MVVTGLWDSFADDAFIRDSETGLYFDPTGHRRLSLLEKAAEAALSSPPR